MIRYLEINRNSKGRKTGDCSTRALSGTLGITYEDALRCQCEESLRSYYDPTSKQVMDKILSKYGFVKMKQPRKADNTKYQVRELDKILTRQQMIDGVFVIVANHCTCIKDGVLQDIWNCGQKYVGNYWVKLK